MRQLCHLCGVDMWPCRPDKLYCNRTCKREYFKRLEAEAKAEAIGDRRCAICGEPIAFKKRAEAKFCSTNCCERDKTIRRRKRKP